MYKGQALDTDNKLKDSGKIVSPTLRIFQLTKHVPIGVMLGYPVFRSCLGNHADETSWVD